MVVPDSGIPPQPYSGYSVPPRQATSGVAIAALVVAILFAPVGLVLAYVARSQIKRSGEGGWDLTTAALIIAWVQIAPVVIIGLWIAFAMLYHELPIFSPLLNGVVKNGPEQYIGATVYTVIAVAILAVVIRKLSK